MLGFNGVRWVIGEMRGILTKGVVTDIQRVDPLPYTAAQGMPPLLRPGLHVVQPMVGLREHMGQPDHGHSVQAEAHPVAVRRKVLVQQGLDPHPFQLGQHQGDVIDAFTDNGQSLGPAETFPQCSKPLQI